MGSDCSWHREQLHTQIDPRESLTEDGAGHPSGTTGTGLEVVILPSWLDEGYSNFYEHRCHTFAIIYIARDSFATQPFAS